MYTLHLIKPRTRINPLKPMRGSSDTGPRVTSKKGLGQKYIRTRAHYGERRKLEHNNRTNWNTITEQ